jgi:hypothetical protein
MLEYSYFFISISHEFILSATMDGNPLNEYPLIIYGYVDNNLF